MTELRFRASQWYQSHLYCTTLSAVYYGISFTCLTVHPSRTGPLLFFVSVPVSVWPAQSRHTLRVYFLLLADFTLSFWLTHAPAPALWRLAHLCGRESCTGHHGDRCLRHWSRPSVFSEFWDMRDQKTCVQGRWKIQFTSRLPHTFLLRLTHISAVHLISPFRSNKTWFYPTFQFTPPPFFPSH